MVGAIKYLILYDRMTTFLLTNTASHHMITHNKEDIYTYIYIRISLSKISIAYFLLIIAHHDITSLYGRSHDI